MGEGKNATGSGFTGSVTEGCIVWHMSCDNHRFLSKSTCRKLFHSVLFCLALLDDWLKDIAPHFQPISGNKRKYNLLACVLQM